MPSEPASSLNASQMRAVDRIVTAFEQVWQNGSEPRLEKYLHETPKSVEAEVLKALLRVDLRQRQRRGQVLPVEEYQARFPQHRDLIAAVYQQASPSTAAPDGPYSTKDVGSSTRNAPENWFYMRNRLPVGPFTFDQLKKLALSGDLRPKDLVSTGG